MISMNEQIENVVDLILEDYRGERDIDKINLLQQPDKDVMEDVIAKLRRIVFPGFGADKNYRIYNAKCTSLASAPVLSSTTLAMDCYNSMFYGCTSLTTAPVLPAETLYEGSYRFMFQSCSSLNYIKCLATDISAPQSTDGWVYNVSPSGTFIKASGMNDWGTNISGIPSGWTVQNA